MGPLSETELAYVAGLFDGEGCVRIQRHLQSLNGKKQRCEMYVLMVQISNNDPRMVYPVREMFGGSVHITKHKRPQQRDTYVWITTSQVALRFLKTIRPYLRGKADQADIAIEFQEAKRRHGAPDPKTGRFVAGLRKPQAEIEIERQQYAEITALKFRTFNPADFGMGANSGDTQNGQSRAKQGASLGVCNEQVPPATAKMCSDLSGNRESAAETTAPGPRPSNNSATTTTLDCGSWVTTTSDGPKSETRSRSSST